MEKAGAGDGPARGLPSGRVLVLDTQGNGQITQRNQVVFTDWDPTAKDDMQALRDVFDTNHNGFLDSGDAQYSSFKIFVTNADGTTTLQTLAQANILSINLIPDATNIVQPDGSVIQGQSTFNKVSGGTGTAAAVSLHYDTHGNVIRQTVTHTADGSTTW